MKVRRSEAFPAFSISYSGKNRIVKGQFDRKKKRFSFKRERQEEVGR